MAIHNLSEGITLNEKQQQFASLVSQGKSCCLVGAAGTGKTTAVRHAISMLLENNMIPTITTPTGTPQNRRLVAGLPGVVGCAFTRRAVANLKANFPEELHDHCMTIHGLLEFAPTTYEEIDDDGKFRTKMVFEPRRNKYNPLPRELTTIFIEESSMVGTDLHNLLEDAIPVGHKVQLVYLGDINQLSPVFGDAVLGYKLLELPAIVLTEVYRQALESPIIRLAHRILSGKQILFPELSKPEAEGGQWQVQDKLKILNWAPKTEAMQAEATALAYLKHLKDKGEYDPYEDMVIVPFNKAFGTIALSKGIANFLDEETNTHPTEIISGYNKLYFAEGDHVVSNNDDAVILKIVGNGRYYGKLIPNTEYVFDRFGNILGRKDKAETAKELAEMHKSKDQMLEDIMLLAEEGVTEITSHIVYIVSPEDLIATKEANPDCTYEELQELCMSRAIAIDTRGAMNKIFLSYSTTCHKAQGLEARRVFIFVHKSHGVLTNREWLYTGITRAKESLTILCERDTFVGGINKQQIKGTTLEEKAEFFKGKKLAQRSLT